MELSDSEKRALWSELSRAKYKSFALGESGEPWDDAGYRVRVEDTAGKLVGELILWEGEWEGKVRLDTTPFHIWLKEADGLRARLDGILSNRMRI